MHSTSHIAHAKAEHTERFFRKIESLLIRIQLTLFYNVCLIFEIFFVVSKTVETKIKIKANGNDAEVAVARHGGGVSFGVQVL